MSTDERKTHYGPRDYRSLTIQVRDIEYHDDKTVKEIVYSYAKSPNKFDTYENRKPADQLRFFNLTGLEIKGYYLVDCYNQNFEKKAYASWLWCRAMHVSQRVALMVHRLRLNQQEYDFPIDQEVIKAMDQVGPIAWPTYLMLREEGNPTPKAYEIVLRSKGTLKNTIDDMLGN